MAHPLQFFAFRLIRIGDESEQEEAEEGEDRGKHEQLDHHAEDVLETVLQHQKQRSGHWPSYFKRKFPKLTKKREKKHFLGVVEETSSKHLTNMFYVCACKYVNGEPPPQSKYQHQKTKKCSPSTPAS